MHVFWYIKEMEKILVSHSKGHKGHSLDFLSDLYFHRLTQQIQTCISFSSIALVLFFDTYTLLFPLSILLVSKPTFTTKLSLVWKTAITKIHYWSKVKFEMQEKINLGHKNMLAVNLHTLTPRGPGYRILCLQVKPR